MNAYDRFNQLQAYFSADSHERERRVMFVTWRKARLHGMTKYNIVQSKILTRFT